MLTIDLRDKTNKEERVFINCISKFLNKNINKNFLYVSGLEKEDFLEPAPIFQIITYLEDKSEELMKLILLILFLK